MDRGKSDRSRLRYNNGAPCEPYDFRAMLLPARYAAFTDSRFLNPET